MKLNRYIAIKSATAFLLVTAACTAMAQGIPTATPESVGMSSARLQAMKSALQTEIDQGKFPGAIVMIARNGKLVFSKHSASWTKPPASL